MSTKRVYDLLIVGAGPAGMSAAINGASEGLSVCMIDGNSWLGGQARESHAIENYPGFPEGITGNDLMNRFTDQASKFNTEIDCPVKAQNIRKEPDGTIVVTAEDYEEYHAKTVLLGLGLSYRRLYAENISKFIGRGVYYGLPLDIASMKRRKCSIVVVGGANSAGQAVMKLAQNPNAHVTMVIRRCIEDQMSTYLIERIKSYPNVDVREGEEVLKCVGGDGMEDVYLKSGEKICAGTMCIFIGAVPKTVWLRGSGVDMDARGFIRTWHDVELHQDAERWHLPFETSMKGVFAAGDVRVGSVKRIAAAIGEGGAALQMIHNRLASYAKAAA